VLHAGRKHRRGSEKEKYGINDIVQPKKNLGRQFAWHGGSELVQHHHIKQARSFHEGLYNINRENSDYGTASRWMSPISAEGRENSRLGRGNDSESDTRRRDITICLLERVVRGDRNYELSAISEGNTTVGVSDPREAHTASAATTIIVIHHRTLAAPLEYTKRHPRQEGNK
jgi:hypothetical protein